MAPLVKSPPLPVVLWSFGALTLGFWLIFYNPGTGFSVQERILIVFVGFMQKNTPVYIIPVMIMSYPPAGNIRPRE